MKLSHLFAFVAVAVACACCRGMAGTEVSRIQESESALPFDHFVEDAASKKPILDLVNAHIARNVKAHGHLVYSGVPGGRKREFTIVQVFDVVSLDEGVYTVQVDVDELRGKPRLLLFFGVIKEGGSYELKDVRLGPEHLRQVAAH